MTKTGDPYYQAPELLTSLTYGLEVDLWMAGVTLYHLKYGYLPFMSTNISSLHQMIKSADFKLN